MPQIKVSTVTVSYNRIEGLRRLSDCLENQTYDRIEKVLVIQGKQPPEDVLNKFDVVVGAKERDNVSYGRNTGVRESSGEIIAFTDDDCLPREDWIEEAVSVFSNGDIGGLEGRIEGGTAENNVDKLRGYCTANIFYRREVFNSIGYFDEKFTPHYREDTDFAWRAIEDGWNIAYCEDVVVDHPEKDEEHSCSLYANDVRLYKKHPEKFKDMMRTFAISSLPCRFYGWFLGCLKYRTVMNFFVALEPFKRRLFQELRFMEVQ